MVLFAKVITQPWGL